MASPEVLGISSGAAFGVVFSLAGLAVLVIASFAALSLGTRRHGLALGDGGFVA